MALTITCAHFLAGQMPAHGGCVAFVVTGMPANAGSGLPTTHAGQCPTGAHADVPGGWRVTVPRSAIRHRKVEQAMAPCPMCTTNSEVNYPFAVTEQDGTVVQGAPISTCLCCQCGCCLTALRRILLEHAGLPLGLAVHTDPTMTSDLTPSVSGTT